MNKKWEKKEVYKNHSSWCSSPSTFFVVDRSSRKWLKLFDFDYILFSISTISSVVAVLRYFIVCLTEYSQLKLSRDDTTWSFIKSYNRKLFFCNLTTILANYFISSCLLFQEEKATPRVLIEFLAYFCKTIESYWISRF